MRTITFTDFRKKASGFITDVEKGETLILVRRGKPVAEISPYCDEIRRIPSWKKPGIKLEIKGCDLGRSRGWFVKLTVDSSAFAKRYVKEIGSEKLDDFLRNASELGLSIVTMPEIISALNRRLREGALSDEDYGKAKKALINDMHDATVLQITPGVISKTINLLESNVLRAMDALHVACALEWNAQLFVTADRRQFDAAKNSGLNTEFLGHLIS
jgi:hypothetical protein